MPNYSTPGVYVEEISTLAPSIAEVESAVPAFVGYTEKADLLVPGDLMWVPTLISSFDDFVQYYGNAAPEAAANITIDVTEYKVGTRTVKFGVKVTPVVANLQKYIFYHSIKLFFANGGGDCYIVSVGDYAHPIKKEDLLKGLDAVALEDIPTLISVPEAVKLAAGYDEVVSAIINQAANLKDRFALLDTFTTTTPKNSVNIAADVDSLKNVVPIDNEIRRYGAGYYPFLESSYNYNFDFNSLTITNYTLIKDGVVDPGGVAPAGNFGTLQNTNSLLYGAVVTEFSKSHIILPPSPAVAGIIARVDREKGYWKAPANVGVTNVTRPVVYISFQEHGNLNIDPATGKSINVIVWQPGNGTVLMGARTLDGNDNEWRYVNVRRFFSIVEESVKKSTTWAVFEPNTAPTWVKVQSMIENYLYLKWRDGALAGAKPEEAYEVNVGLNKTMTAQDILEGRMIVEIKMAVARPAEFIVLKFEQLMQTS
jgi:phage tail sheath protein FI